MARTESEQLVFSIEARIAAMEKQMARGGRIVDTTFTGMERRSKRAAQTMEKEMANGAARVGSIMKNFGKGLFAGVLAGGVAGIVSEIGQVAKGVASIGDEAKRAGVSARAFQEWKFVAEQNRIGIDQMTDGLKELSLRADEFATTGKGSAADAFARLGYGAEELKKKLKDPSALMLEIIGRLQRLNSDASRIRLADEIFGSAGERFVELLDQGEAGIRKTIDRAHDLGVVMSDDLIKRAAELDQRFNEVSNTVGVFLKGAIVSAADSLAEFIDGFREFEKQRSRTLDSKVKDLGSQRLDIETEILRLQEEQRHNTSVFAAGEGKILEAALAAKRDELANLSKQEAEILAILNSRTQPMAVNDRTWTPPEIPPSSTARGGSGRDSAAASAEREAEAIRRLIAELEEELRLVGASDTQKQISATLRRANVDAASAEGKQIAALITEIERETEALEKNRQAQEARTEAIGNMFEMGGDALMSIVDGSARAEDAVKRLAVQLALAAAQAAFLGSGPLAGLFGGSIFGGGFKPNMTASHFFNTFSSGGYTGSGGKYEPAGVVHKGEVVWSQDDVRRHGGPHVVEAMRRRLPGFAGGGLVGTPQIASIPVPSVPKLAAPARSHSSSSMTISIDVTGARGNAEIMDMVQKGVSAGIRAYDANSTARTVNDFREARRRRML